MSWGFSFFSGGQIISFPTAGLMTRPIAAFAIAAISALPVSLGWILSVVDPATPMTAQIVVERSATHRP